MHCLNLIILIEEGIPQTPCYPFPPPASRPRNRDHAKSLKTQKLLNHLQAAIQSRGGGGGDSLMKQTGI